MRHSCDAKLSPSPCSPSTAQIKSVDSADASLPSSRPEACSPFTHGAHSRLKPIGHKTREANSYSNLASYVILQTVPRLPVSVLTRQAARSKPLHNVILGHMSHDQQGFIPVGIKSKRFSPFIFTAQDVTHQQHSALNVADLEVHVRDLAPRQHLRV